MRSLIVLLTASLAACSGLPPETLPLLQGGEAVTGVTIAFDMHDSPNPSGTFVWPRRSVVQGPSLGVGAQKHKGWE